jgi:hypothetical protein
VLNCPSLFGQIEECRFPDVLGNVVVAFLQLNESGDPNIGVAVGSVCGRMSVQLATLLAARYTYVGVRDNHQICSFTACFCSVINPHYLTVTPATEDICDC